VSVQIACEVLQFQFLIWRQRRKVFVDGVRGYTLYSRRIPIGILIFVDNHWK